ncbi:MAG: hypothetical protein ACYTEQ_31360 [Planctomycetota bacterium]
MKWGKLTTKEEVEAERERKKGDVHHQTAVKEHATRVMWAIVKSDDRSGEIHAGFNPVPKEYLRDVESLLTGWAEGEGYRFWMNSICCNLYLLGDSSDQPVGGDDD